MTKSLFYIGILFMALSYIISVYNPYYLGFSIPVFILGTVLLFLSNETLKLKLIILFVPIIIYIPLSLLWLKLYNYSSPKAIRIPNNYQGILRVVYEEECGSEYKEIDGVKTLIFPQNGILVLNEKFDSHVNYQFYLIDLLGNKKNVPLSLSAVNVKNDTCVYFVRSASVTLYNNKLNNDKNKGITYKDFYVTNPSINSNNTSYNLIDIQSNKIDSLSWQYVMKCRRLNKLN